MKIRERIATYWWRARVALTPPDSGWRGAATGIHAVAALVIAGILVSFVAQDFTVYKLAAVVVIVGALLIAGALGLAVFVLIGKLNARYRAASFLLAPLVVMWLAPSGDWKGRALPVALLLLASLIGGAIGVLGRRGARLSRHRLALAALIAGFALFASGIYAVFSPKAPANPLLTDFVLEDRTLDLENPGLPGEYEVLTLTYGSGNDRHRPEYGKEAGLVSRSVDGSKLIDNWDGAAGWTRTKFWGFDAKALPLQARVWYPAGDGPFPLVLVVHGNHAMEDFSDPGYGYLGELFASRGIILASVDANFLNSSISSSIDVLSDRPGLKEENDARGWLLLEHLAQWRDWNDDPGHRFHGRVDIDRVALIGHSRGGEAVGVAAVFNALSRYPDDATLEFDFGFNLRGVIAIAPVDGQYRPREVGTPIRDVNYFTIHGSMDGDVQSFEGTAQYSRVTFNDPLQAHFKSSLYVVGANHGQFNTTWENLDTGIFSAWMLNLGGIMPAEDQRDVARVYFGAFAEIVLRDRTEYLPIFADARRAAAWLPHTYYINQFAESGQQPITDFEEDIDPATMSLPGGGIVTSNLTKWYETRIKLKRDTLETHAAVFAWDSRVHDESASVDFELPREAPLAGQGRTLILSLSDPGVGTLPEGWEAGDDAATDNAGEDDKDQPLDWTLVLRDGEGREAVLPLSHDQVLYPRVQAVPRRASFLDDTEPAEVLLRRYEFAIDDFAASDPAFDSGDIATIGFVFDASPRGAVMVDDISIR